jgi:hypothetical protein
MTLRGMLPVLCVVAAAAIVASGCGGSSKPDPAAQRAAAQRRAKAKAQAEYQKCKSQLGGIVDAEETLNSHLSVGMNYHDYTSEVGDVKAAYDQVPFKQLDFQCLGAGLPAEKALNAYAKAANIWDTCFNDINCSNDSIKPQLQAQWDKAGSQAEDAKSKLGGLQTPNASP